MKRLLLHCILLSFVWFGTSDASVSGADEGLGISSWAGWRPGQVSRADCPELRSVPLILSWTRLEPNAGRIRIRQVYRRATARRGGRRSPRDVDDLGSARHARSGLFDLGVPKVYTDREVNPLGQKMSKEDNLHPYYLHPEYKRRFFALIDAFGDYVNGLPADLRKRIVFVQSAEGSTGDGQPYKGNPLDAQYAIPKDVWNDFRKETWNRYQKAFPDIPILVNSDANRRKQTAWLLDNMDVIALKHGMFSHGYHVSDNNERLERFRCDPWPPPAKRGKPV